ncbi:MAG: 7-cyano-7-deazaguanine synthase [Candidatus Lokiarchaeota archaeon]|nr:7-cyano-7-deazaguanine synthase [Candidatus Lokiarchaeota archaeon]
MKKAIVLYSGGLDSVTSLYWVKNQGYSPIALSFMEHGRQKSEIKAARKLMERWDIPYIEIPLEFIMQKDELQKIGINLSGATDLPTVYIPQKNLIFYSIAAYYAEIYKAEAIIVGLLSFDFNIFPDNSLEFFERLENIINIGLSNSSKTIKIIFPLKTMGKSEVIQLAFDLGVPMELTWSCYEEEDDNGNPCGKCKGCLERRQGFKKLNANDPLLK